MREPDAIRAAERIIRGDRTVKSPTPKWAYAAAGFLMVFGVLAILALCFLAWVGSIALGVHIARALGWL